MLDPSRCGHSGAIMEVSNMVKFLELTLEDMLVDAREKYSNLDLDGLGEVLKSLKSNVRYAEALDIARLKAHAWITDGRYKALEKNNPEFIKVNEFEVKTVERMRIKEGKIEKYMDKMHRLVHDFREDFEGREVSEVQLLEYIDIDADDMNLDTLEKIKKYAVAENLDGLKRAKASAKFEQSMRKIAEAAAALQNHKTKISVIVAFQAALRAENAEKIVKSRAGFLNAEGQKLFGIGKTAPVVTTIPEQSEVVETVA